MKRPRVVSIGRVKVGGAHPVSIQSMVKTHVENIPGVLKEVQRLKDAGCEILRFAVEREESASLITRIKEKIDIPVEADVHFDAKLGLQALSAGADAVRLNPMNIKKQKDILRVAALASKLKKPIRVGINSGGFSQKLSEKELAWAMVRRVSGYIKLLERIEFYDIILSLKASSTQCTVLANRFASREFPYPLHLGVTATGPKENGIVKSAIALGTLLSEGVGNTIRISLNSVSIEEVRIAKLILQSLHLRVFFPEIISCPTCSRCRVDLITMVERFQKMVEALPPISVPLTVALMGCPVNGPGEAAQADFGCAFGRGFAAFFRKGKIVRRIAAESALEVLYQTLKEQVQVLNSQGRTNS